MKKTKNGFAISGILYPILILTLFLVVQMLFMLQTRKNVLDKSRTELSDTINSSNQVYNNEELSVLINELQNKVTSQNAEITKTNSEVAKLTSENATLKSLINQNIHNTFSLVADLNKVTENSPGLIGMDPSTLNRPPTSGSQCDYGVVENLTFGKEATAASGTYWRFQIAHCTVGNNIYIRTNVNNEGWGDWTSH